MNRDHFSPSIAFFFLWSAIDFFCLCVTGPLSEERRKLLYPLGAFGVPGELDVSWEFDVPSAALPRGHRNRTTQETSYSHYPGDTELALLREYSPILPALGISSSAG